MKIKVGDYIKCDYDGEITGYYFKVIAIKADQFLCIMPKNWETIKNTIKTNIAGWLPNNTEEYGKYNLKEERLYWWFNETNVLEIKCGFDNYFDLE